MHPKGHFCISALQHLALRGPTVFRPLTEELVLRLCEDLWLSKTHHVFQEVAMVVCRGVYKKIQNNFNYIDLTVYKIMISHVLGMYLVTLFHDVLSVY